MLKDAEEKSIYTMDVTTIHNIKPSRWPCFGLTVPFSSLPVVQLKISLQVPFVKGLFGKRAWVSGCEKLRGLTSINAPVMGIQTASNYRNRKRQKLPSGKRLQKTMERSTMLLMGKLTISMAIFNSYFDITRG